MDLRQNMYEGEHDALEPTPERKQFTTGMVVASPVSPGTKIDQLREDIARKWRQYEPAFRQAEGKSHLTALSIGWDDECKRWESQIVELNQLVSDYNLRQRPSSNLEIFKLRLESDELKEEACSGKAPRYLL
ncbi:MAG: hypothetical protein R3C44_19400 [Chloroflexota bacterium]